MKFTYCRFFALSLILAGVQVRASAHLPQCPALLKFVTRDFLPSNYALTHTPRKNSDLFLNLMVVWTEETVRELQANFPLPPILDNLSKKRRQAFTHLEGVADNTKNPYGLFRWSATTFDDSDRLESYLGKSSRNFEGYLQSGREAHEVYENPITPSDWAARAVRFVARNQSESFPFADPSDTSIFEFGYATLGEDTAFPIFQIQLDYSSTIFDPSAYPEVSLLSADTRNARLLYEDFVRNSSLLLDSNDMAIWSRQLRNYFAAMYFMRGSAAIGRSFWTAVLSYKFGKKVVLPAEIDLYALTTSEEEFHLFFTKTILGQ